MLNKNHVAIPPERPRRSAMLSVRLTQDERQLITTFASQHNVQISRLVRACVLQAINRHNRSKHNETD